MQEFNMSEPGNHEEPIGRQQPPERGPSDPANIPQTPPTETPLGFVEDEYSMIPLEEMTPEKQEQALNHTIVAGYASLPEEERNQIGPPPPESASVAVKVAYYENLLRTPTIAKQHAEQIERLAQDPDPLKVEGEDGQEENLVDKILETKATYEDYLKLPEGDEKNKARAVAEKKVVDMLRRVGDQKTIDKMNSKKDVRDWKSLYWFLIIAGISLAVFAQATTLVSRIAGGKVK